VEVCLLGVVLQWKAYHRPGKAWSGPSGWKGCCWSLSSLIFGFCWDGYALFALLD
jgi:hypothetical protein